MESLLLSVISSYLKDYVNNFRREQISVNFLRGQGVIRDLDINVDALNELVFEQTYPGLRFSRIMINKLSIDAPIMSLGTKPIVIFIDEIFIEISEVPEITKQQRSHEEAKKQSGKYGYINRILDAVSLQVNKVFIGYRTLGKLKTASVGPWTPPVLLIELSGNRYFSTNERSVEAELDDCFRIHTSKRQTLFVYKKFESKKASMYLVEPSVWFEVVDELTADNKLANRDFYRYIRNLKLQGHTRGYVISKIGSTPLDFLFCMRKRMDNCMMLGLEMSIILHNLNFSMRQSMFSEFLSLILGVGYSLFRKDAVEQVYDTFILGAEKDAQQAHQSKFHLGKEEIASLRMLEKGSLAKSVTKEAGKDEDWQRSSLNSDEDPPHKRMVIAVQINKATITFPFDDLDVKYNHGVNGKNRGGGHTAGIGTGREQSSRSKSRHARHMQSGARHANSTGSSGGLTEKIDRSKGKVISGAVLKLFGFVYCSIWPEHAANTESVSQITMKGFSLDSYRGAHQSTLVRVTSVIDADDKPIPISLQPRGISEYNSLDYEKFPGICFAYKKESNWPPPPIDKGVSNKTEMCISATEITVDMENCANVISFFVGSWDSRWTTGAWADSSAGKGIPEKTAQDVHDSDTKSMSVIINGVDLVFYPNQELKYQSLLEEVDYDSAGQNLLPAQVLVHVGYSTLVWQHTLKYELTPYMFASDGFHGRIPPGSDPFIHPHESADLTTLLARSTAQRSPPVIGGRSASLGSGIAGMSRSQPSPQQALLSSRMEANVSEIIVQVAVNTNDSSGIDSSFKHSSSNSNSSSKDLDENGAASSILRTTIKIGAAQYFTSLDPHPNRETHQSLLTRQQKNIFNREYYWQTEQNMVQTSCISLSQVVVSSTVLDLLRTAETHKLYSKLIDHWVANDFSRIRKLKGGEGETPREKSEAAALKAKRGFGTTAPSSLLILKCQPLSVALYASSTTGGVSKTSDHSTANPSANERKSSGHDELIFGLDCVSSIITAEYVSPEEKILTGSVANSHSLTPSSAASKLPTRQGPDSDDDDDDDDNDDLMNSSDDDVSASGTYLLKGALYQFDISASPTAQFSSFTSGQYEDCDSHGEVNVVALQVPLASLIQSPVTQAQDSLVPFQESPLQTPLITFRWIPSMGVNGDNNEQEDNVESHTGGGSTSTGGFQSQLSLNLRDNCLLSINPLITEDLAKRVISQLLSGFGMINRNPLHWWEDSLYGYIMSNFVGGMEDEMEISDGSSSLSSSTNPYSSVSDFTDNHEGEAAMAVTATVKSTKGDIEKTVTYLVNMKLTGFGFLIRDVQEENSMLMTLDDCTFAYEVSNKTQSDVAATGLAPRQYVKILADVQMFMQVPNAQDSHGMRFAPIYAKNKLEVVYDNLSPVNYDRKDPRMLTRLKFDELLSYCNAQSIARLTTLYRCFYYGSMRAWGLLRNFAAAVEGSSIPMYDAATFETASKLVDVQQSKVAENYSDVLELLELGGLFQHEQELQNPSEAKELSLVPLNFPQDIETIKKREVVHGVHFEQAQKQHQRPQGSTVSKSKSSITVLLEEELCDNFLRLKNVERKQIRLREKLRDDISFFDSKIEKLNVFLNKTRHFSLLYGGGQVPVYCGWVSNSNSFNKAGKSAPLSKHWVTVIQGTAYFLLLPNSAEVEMEISLENIAVIDPDHWETGGEKTSLTSKLHLRNEEGMIMIWDLGSFDSKSAWLDALSAWYLPNPDPSPYTHRRPSKRPSGFLQTTGGASAATSAGTAEGSPPGHPHQSGSGRRLSDNTGNIFDAEFRVEKTNHSKKLLKNATHEVLKVLSFGTMGLKKKAIRKNTQVPVPPSPAVNADGASSFVSPLRGSDTSTVNKEDECSHRGEARASFDEEDISTAAAALDGDITIPSEETISGHIKSLTFVRTGFENGLSTCEEVLNMVNQAQSSLARSMVLLNTLKQVTGEAEVQTAMEQNSSATALHKALVELREEKEVSKKLLEECRQSKQSRNELDSVLQAITMQHINTVQELSTLLDETTGLLGVHRGTAMAPSDNIGAHYPVIGSTTPPKYHISGNTGAALGQATAKESVSVIHGLTLLYIYMLLVSSCPSLFSSLLRCL